MCDAADDWIAFQTDLIVKVGRIVLGTFFVCFHLRLDEVCLSVGNFESSRSHVTSDERLVACLSREQVTQYEWCMVAAYWEVRWQPLMFERDIMKCRPFLVLQLYDDSNKWVSECMQEWGGYVRSAESILWMKWWQRHKIGNLEGSIYFLDGSLNNIVSRTCLVSSWLTCRIYDRPNCINIHSINQSIWV